MQKNHFHNFSTINKNVDKIQTHYTPELYPKIVVDINKLLNRVKTNEKKEAKRKIVFFSLVILCISILGTIIAFIK